MIVIKQIYNLSSDLILIIVDRVIRIALHAHNVLLRMQRRQRAGKYMLLLPTTNNHTLCGCVCLAREKDHRCKPIARDHVHCNCMFYLSLLLSSSTSLARMCLYVPAECTIALYSLCCVLLGDSTHVACWIFQIFPKRGPSEREKGSDVFIIFMPHTYIIYLLQVLLENRRTETERFAFGRRASVYIISVCMR